MEWEAVKAVLANENMRRYHQDTHHIYRILAGTSIHAPNLTARIAGILVRRPAVPLPYPVPGQVRDRPWLSEL
jgi:hypothetical protein